VLAFRTQATRSLIEGDAALREQIDAPAIVHSAGDRDMVDVLLEFGADVNAKSSWWAGGFTTLHHVTGRMVGFDEEMAAYLIERGADIDAWSAASLGMLDRLSEIVDADAEVVNRPGPDGMRPLHCSATAEIAQLLLDRGADVDAKYLDHHGTVGPWLQQHGALEVPHRSRRRRGHLPPCSAWRRPAH